MKNENRNIGGDVYLEGLIEPLLYLKTKKRLCSVFPLKCRIPTMSTVSEIGWPSWVGWGRDIRLAIFVFGVGVGYIGRGEMLHLFDLNASIWILAAVDLLSSGLFYHPLYSSDE